MDARKVLYKGSAVAMTAYLELGADDACCGICQETRAEHEEALREEPPVAAALNGGGGGGGGGGGAAPEVPPNEEAAVIKALFVVPLCPADVPHLYHRKCLKDWLKRPDHNVCPMCIQPVVREGTPTHSAPPSQVSSLEAPPTPPAPPAPLREVEIAILDACAEDGFALWLYPPPADLVLADWEDPHQRGFAFTVETAATDGGCKCGRHCVLIQALTQAMFDAIKNQLLQNYGDATDDDVDGGKLVWNF